MEPGIIALIAVIVLFIIMFLGLPIGFAMALMGFVGVSLIASPGAGLSILGNKPYTTAASYELSVIPLFIFMGLIASQAGMITDAYQAFHKWFGRMPAGLANATIAACAAFAAVTGSSVAGAAVMSRVSLPEMLKNGYDRRLATGTVAAGGTLGILIPPSGPMILYGVMTETSIGKLFIAGIIPGILLSLLFIVQIIIQAKLNPTLAPPGPKATWNERISSLKGVVAILVLFLFVIGGIYLGVFTPTEAGAIGAFGALVIAIIKRGLTKKGLSKSITETIQTTGMIFVILIGAFILNYLMVLSKFPTLLSDFLSAIHMSRYIIFIVIMLIYLFLGCLMNAIAMILLTMPIFFPVISNLGFDPVWFGIVCILQMELASITPPVGMNVFIVAGASDVPMYDVFIGAAPFVVTMIIMLVLMTVFPQIVLVLPNTMK
ncbi:MAG: TRAP transporter large permease [Chloroflexota bacterium]